MPASGQPGAGGPDDPLRLGRAMRLRLRAAVQALLADESIAGQSDVAKLAAVVLLAKSRAPKGHRDDSVTSIWVAELGRWMGVGESTVHRRALAPLRASDGLHTEEVRDEQGCPTGLRCLVMPLWRARKHGGAGHPLALGKAELATLLRLCEALFGHGWSPEGKEPTPPGLLASRSGKGAATDRLGLLLMVLNTPGSGWLPLCGGSMRKAEKKHGRGAVTLARLLGCSPAGARKVLDRLDETGVVAREHRSTTTRMRGRGRVRLLPVACAYGRALEVVQNPNNEFSARPGSAGGDLAPAGTADALGTPGICEGKDAELPESQERPDSAELHALHASVVTPVVPLQLSCGFSGEGRGAEGRRPERACAGEGQAVDGESAIAGTGSPVAEDGPLREEKPKESPVDDERVGQRPAETGAGGQPKAVGWHKAQRQRRVGLPDDLRLRVALAPVAWLWERLSGWQQDQVEAAAKTELVRLGGLLALPGGAPRLLAARLADRLEETGGEALIGRPFGWLIRRGLVQRPSCSDLRCDDGTRIDTGTACETCANVVHLRRARRARVAAEISREQPGLTDDERLQALEGRLRELAVLDAEDFVWRRKQTAAEQARRDAARAAAQERAEHERQAAAAQEAARQVLPCTDCGRARAAGLCEACGYRRRVTDLLTEAEQVTVASLADPTNAEAAARAVEEVRETLGAITRAARQRYLNALEPGQHEADPEDVRTLLAYNELEVLKQVVPQIRTSALATLAHSTEADAEARRAYRTEQGRRWFQHNPTGAHAVAAATKEAEAARTRAAEYLLAMRLEQLHQQVPLRPKTALAASSATSDVSVEVTA
ncbi:hypothetical protein ABT096_29330 [Streptomyces sp. NPDC002561]|uniref:hypothetical protein n=1 Tax=Streptomyces sp. NPDC002561 TaxID=3154418 RepID=UPI00333052C4